MAALLLAGCGDQGRKHALPASSSRGTEDKLIASALADAGREGKTVTLAGADTLHVGPSALTFYRSRGWRSAWTDADGLTDPGKAVLAQLARTWDDGLSPERYHYSTIQRLASMVQSARDDATRASAGANLDLVVSEGFARYADDLAGGTVDPKELGLEWHLPQEHAPKVQALQLLASGQSPTSIVASLRPHTVIYARMMSALARYRQVAARGGWSQVGTGAVANANMPARDTTTNVATRHAAARGGRRESAVASNATGVVASIRNRLMAGDDSTEAALAAAGRAAPDVMDARLRQAVVHFQQRHDLPADGKPTKQTIAQMNVPVADRIRTLELNMDRWRWLPRDLGSFYVMVNLPAFKVDVMQGDSTVMEQKVVVGKPGWTTPMFADRMVSLVVNPYWNVPKSIVAEELGPEMAKDPNYLAKHHFEQTSDGGYRQMPGPKNSLGLFKFQLTNDQDIYLHDTPAKDLFSKDDRDLSHGCIRLQDAHAMAVLIGQHEGISQETIDAARASGQNHVLDFKRPVPTYIMYFTAAVQPDGSIHYYPDVYGLDQRLQTLAPKLEGRPVDSTQVAQDSAMVADSIKRVKASHAGQSTD
ncbi:MAG TPA: L,D-transpeptidase family protein [Longimicrobiales bacterium]